jgi:hypothetical protein
VRARLALALATLAALAVAVAACAQLVGADFGDEYLRGSDGGTTSPGSDAGSTSPTGDAGGSPTVDAASPPPVAADGGICPTGLTDCGGLCFDLTSSPEHCGKCSTSCPNDPHGAGVCVVSHCTFACDDGWVECPGGCCGPGTDASSPGEDSGPPGTDSGPATDPGIACGADYCVVASNSFCCAKSTGDVCDTVLSDPCPQIFCDNSVECGGAGVCCYDVSTTQTLCEPTSCSAGQNQMCDPAASGECTGGAQCTGTIMPGTTTYSVCQ